MFQAVHKQPARPPHVLVRVVKPKRQPLKPKDYAFIEQSRKRDLFQANVLELP